MAEIIATPTSANCLHPVAGGSCLGDAMPKPCAALPVPRDGRDGYRFRDGKMHRVLVDGFTSLWRKALGAATSRGDCDGFADRLVAS